MRILSTILFTIALLASGAAQQNQWLQGPVISTYPIGGCGNCVANLNAGQVPVVAYQINGSVNVWWAQPAYGEGFPTGTQFSDFKWQNPSYIFFVQQLDWMQAAGWRLIFYYQDGTGLHTLYAKLVQ